MKLGGGKVFSKLDLAEAYLQIHVNEECAKYLSIKTQGVCIDSIDCLSEKGLHQAFFQQITDTLLNDVDFEITYFDNILIKNESREHHAEYNKEVFFLNKPV